MVYSSIYLPKYFEKNLYSYDECLNSVVSANLYRDFWNPSVRINSLVEEYQGWTEGPQWQHIPPLFAYVPLPLFWLDGKVSIEMKRLSYVIVSYLMFALMILYFSSYLKNSLLTLATFFVSVLWTNSPFVKGLLQGGYFGFSDIVLVFSISISIIYLIHFLVYKRQEFYALNELSFVFYGFIFALPLIVKNVLGGLPIFLFFLLLLKTYKHFNRYILTFLLSVFFFLGLHYGIQFFKNPEVFRNEFLFSFDHFGDVEGWERPWHYFLSNYLPNLYLKPMLFHPFITILVSTIIYYLKKRQSYNYKDKVLLDLLLIFSMLHIVAISFISSKSPNFLLQSFHFILIFVIYNMLLIANRKISFSNFLLKKCTLIFVSILCAVSMFYFVNKFKSERQQNSVSAHPYFLLSEEISRKLQPTLSDIFLTYTDSKTQLSSGADFWMRYYILFVTGTESREIKEFISLKNEIHKNFERYFIITKADFEPPKSWEQVLIYSDYSVWKTRPSEISF